jgi:pilus assembly protein FimV
VKISKLRTVFLVGIIALLPISANAAKLGGLTVLSNLGEPFNAEIRLFASDEEMATLTARIASVDVYKEQGIEFSSSLTNVKVELAKQPNGTSVIRLSSAQPHGTPFLDMLIEVEWGTGRTMREYTTVPNLPVLNEPPHTVNNAPPIDNPAPSPLPDLPAAPAASEQTPSTTAELSIEQISEVPGNQNSPISSEAINPPKPHNLKSNTKTKREVNRKLERKTEDYITKKGDTLHSIAVKHRVEGVSLEQMLVGIFRENNGAFAKNNMNQLKVRQKIHVPGLEQLQATSQSEAIEEIRVQTADWDLYRINLAMLTKAAVTSKEQDQAQTANGKITALTTKRSESVSTGARDVVKLSTGGTHDGKAGVADTSKHVSALQEDAIAREKEIKEAGEKNTLLEKQVQNMSKLLEIKNQMLAQSKIPPKDHDSGPLDFMMKHLALIAMGVAGLSALAIAIWFNFRGRGKSKK